MKRVIYIVLFISITSCGRDDHNVPKSHSAQSNTPLAIAASPDFCQQMSANSAIKTYAAKELKFFCDEQQLQKLVSHANQAAVLENIASQLSHITIGTYMTTKASIADAITLSKLYCEDFATYRSYFPEKVYGRVQDIPTWNIANEGCDFEFIGKKILWYQARYKGKTVRYDAVDGQSYVNLTYLTEKGSLVERAISLTLVAQQGEFLHYWNLTSSSNDSKGFHDTVVSEMRESSELSLQSIADYLTK